MKRLFPIIVSALAILSTAACDSDSNEYVSAINGFTTCYTNCDGQIDVLCDDMGGRYMVADNDFNMKADTALRLVCSYSVGDNDIATIHNCLVPFCEKPHDIAGVTPKSIVWDPFEVQTAYIGSGYLNMRLALKVMNEESKHSLLPVVLESKDSVIVSFIHDAHGQNPVYTKTAFASIPLAGLGLHKNDTVFFKYKGYEEDHVLKLPYR